MKPKLNKKGFTLVEIVVVLLIVSIVMALAGSMILSSFNLFGDSTQEDVNKRALDKVATYVMGELEFASDIRITSTKPDGDNWSYLDIQNGRLIQNDTASDITKEYSVYTDSFYYDNSLEMSLSHFVNSDQFDIDYTFSKNSAVTYETHYTLKFSNLTLKAKKDETYKPFEGLADSYLLSSDLRIYYIAKSQNTVVEEEKPVFGKGTVADQIVFLNNYNNLQIWNTNTMYRRSDMVFYDGSWWQCMINFQYIDNLPPISNAHGFWKKISAYYDWGSGYEVGDIIIYNDEYYRCKQSLVNTGYRPYPDDPNSGQWEKIVATSTQTVEQIVKSTVYTPSYENKTPIVRSQLDGVDANTISVYEKNKTYKKGDFVKIYADGFEDDDDLAYYYKCVVETTNTDPKTNASYHWKYMTANYDKKSAYEPGDVIIASIRQRLYGQAISYVDKETDIVNEIYSSTSKYWTRAPYYDY